MKDMNKIGCGLVTIGAFICLNQGITEFQIAKTGLSFTAAIFWILTGSIGFWTYFPKTFAKKEAK